MSAKPKQNWESLSESRIRKAVEEGAFRDLPGLGKPIPGIDEVWDENSWAKRKLRDERLNLLPPILEARLQAQRLMESLASIPTEREVRRRVAAVNETIRRAHYSHVAGPAEGIAPLEMEAVVSEWRRREPPVNPQVL